MAEKQLRPIGKTEAKRLSEEMLRDSVKREMGSALRECETHDLDCECRMCVALYSALQEGG